MIFPYLVVHNFVEYPAGTDVPIDSLDNTKVSVEPIEVAVAEETKIEYSKTEINRMSLKELKALASEQEIDGADTKSGSELKKELIKKFGL